MVTKNIKKLWIPLMALNLLPLMASGADPAPQPSGAPAADRAKPRFDDLTLSDLGGIMNFEAVKEGQDPSSRARLFGMIFTDCINGEKGSLVISNSKLDPNLRTEKGVVGFRFTDKGGRARSCMADHADKLHVCSDEFKCTAISQLPGTSMDLSNEGDVAIRMIHLDPNRDRSKIQAEDFETALTHKGAATINQLRIAKINEERNSMIKKLKDQVASCRKNSDERGVALAAAENLESLGLYNDDDVERLKKELSKLELNELTRKFNKASLKNPEQINEILEQLKAFEADHPESADSIAAVIHKKALAAVEKNKTAEGFDQASQLISEAQSLGGLNDLASMRLENNQRDISVGRFQYGAMQGSIDPEEYSTFMQGLMGDIRGCSGKAISGEKCRSTVSAYKAGQSIPMLMQQTQMERYQFEMQMQQQMQMMMSGPMGQGQFGGQFGGSPFMGNRSTSGSQGSGFYK